MTIIVHLRKLSKYCFLIILLYATTCIYHKYLDYFGFYQLYPYFYFALVSIFSSVLYEIEKNLLHSVGIVSPGLWYILAYF